MREREHPLIRHPERFPQIIITLKVQCCNSSLSRSLMQPSNVESFTIIKPASFGRQPGWPRRPKFTWTSDSAIHGPDCLHRSLQDVPPATKPSPALPDPDALLISALSLSLSLPLSIHATMATVHGAHGRGGAAAAALLLPLPTPPPLPYALAAPHRIGGCGPRSGGAPVQVAPVRP